MKPTELVVNIILLALYSWNIETVMSRQDVKDCRIHISKANNQAAWCGHYIVMVDFNIVLFISISNERKAKF